MKKMLTVAAILFAVVGAQASSIAWGSNWAYSYRDPDPGGPSNWYNSGVNAGNAWLVLLASSDTSAISVSGGTLTEGFGNSIVDTESMAGAFGGPAFSAAGVSGTSGNWYTMVIWDSATTLWGVGTAQQVVMAGLPGLETGAAQFSNALGQGNVGEFALVPEPTSLAFLALGAAALGLRRKFRK
jgi:hypothetical protein